ncbi:MAG: ABC transporter ATP-binding protein [Clostridiales Family XIII bacterium]|jgi:iron complex transport system ATP-binding protein|nr:ABC transporter ATP-binding protein [Clostridiales Family XIII bacterium]
MIEMVNLSGGYGRKTAARDVSLAFRDGEVTAVIGPNGCGKSTLLKLCAGQLAPEAGTVRADGRDLSGLRAREIARSVAYMPQSRPVPDMTVGTLALHGRFPWLGYPRVYGEADARAAEEAMSRTGILGKRGEMLARLSGGERQKAYLAMTLAQGTPNLLLDEPATYLDVAVQLELAAIMREAAGEGKCVAAVMHDVAAAAELADRLAVMKDGRLLAAGAPEEVLGSGAVEEAFGIRLSRGERLVFGR